jgi:hypothetical protein
VSIYNVKKISGASPPDPQEQGRDGGKGGEGEGKGREGKGARKETAILCPRKKK